MNAINFCSEIFKEIYNRMDSTVLKNFQNFKLYYNFIFLSLKSSFRHI